MEDLIVSSLEETKEKLLDTKWWRVSEKPSQSGSAEVHMISSPISKVPKFTQTELYVCFIFLP